MQQHAGVHTSGVSGLMRHREESGWRSEPLRGEEVEVQSVDAAKTLAALRRPSHTEAHWVPRPNEHASGGSRIRQKFAPVARVLGERDWVSIDPMRVRTSKGVRHHFTSTIYFRQRMRSHVWCELQEVYGEVL